MSEATTATTSEPEYMMALRGIGGVAGLLKAYAAMAERGEPVTPEMMLRWAGRLDEYHAELWRILVTERK